MKPFSLLIKPSSADCNLRCSYCFYSEKETLYPNVATHRMNSATLGNLISKYLSLGFEDSMFSWQGGEPTLMGLDFFKEAVRLQVKHSKPKQRIANSIQTNGLLLNDDWLAFVNEYNFLVGISLDGPAAITDVNRKDKNNASVFNGIMASIERMKARNVEFNVLSVVNSANFNKAREIYGFLKNLGVKYHQYIPAIITPARPGIGITGEEYGRFLLDLFAEWYPADVNSVSIRLFDAVVSKLVTDNAPYCEFSERCDSYLVVEYNGDIYPCDFFVEKEMRLVNINGKRFEDAFATSVFKRFSELKKPTDTECTACAYGFICQGGCTRHRNYRAADGEGRTALCDGIRMFLEKALPTFKALAAQIKQST